MRPTLAANMLIRALVRGLSCCGGTWAGCSGCLHKFFNAMPAQDLHYHTSSKLALVAHNVSRAHVTLLHKAFHQKLDPPEAPVACAAAPEPARCLCDPLSAPPPAGRFAFRFAFVPFFAMGPVPLICGWHISIRWVGVQLKQR